MKVKGKTMNVSWAPMTGLAVAAIIPIALVVMLVVVMRDCASSHRAEVLRAFAEVVRAWLRGK